jgi:hypothetical protein
MKTLWGEQSTRATGFAAFLFALILGQCRRADPMHAFAELRAYDDNQDLQ